jgi:ribonuclease P protein component
MLPKRQRLTSKDFNLLIKLGKKASNKDFFVRYFFNKENPGSSFKIGVTTSSKISKKAVTRNRIRRIVYSSFRRVNETVFGNKLGFFIGITPRHDISKYKTNELDQSLKNLLSLIKF